MGGVDEEIRGIGKIMYDRRARTVGTRANNGVMGN
jgi:hypothetical protein